MSSILIFILLLVLISFFHVHPSISISLDPTLIQPQNISTSFISCKDSCEPNLCNILATNYNQQQSNLNHIDFLVTKILDHINLTISNLESYKKKFNLNYTNNVIRLNAKISLLIGAVNDCIELENLNLEFINEIFQELEDLKDLNELKVMQIRSLLSSLLANQHTCYEGLVDASTTNAAKLQSIVVEGMSFFQVFLGAITSSMPTIVSGQSFVPDSIEVASARISKSVIVSKYGNGKFNTIQGAINFAPNRNPNDNTYFAIYIREGIYHENVIVNKNKGNLILIGSGISKTIITSNLNGAEGVTTLRSATFTVESIRSRFIAKGITFENSAGPYKHQAVAVRSSADLSTFYSCSFLGYQDTLYVHSGRQFYRQCEIRGTVDFIFGYAAAVFQNCNIFVRNPLPNQHNTITAHGRKCVRDPTAITIQNCNIRADPKLDTRKHRTYLGRPWSDNSRTVYLQSYLGSLVDPAGWLAWRGNTNTVYNGEFDNYGPGASTNRRVNWVGHKVMNRQEASRFTVDSLLHGYSWLPGTAIPYTGGLK